LSTAKKLVRLKKSDDKVEPERDGPLDLRCETSRLILRPLRSSELDSVADLSPPDTSWRDQLRFASELLKGWLTMVAVLKDSDEIVGMFALTNFEIDGQIRCELGYRVHFNQFGKGLATEGATALRDAAFRQLECDCLISIIAPSNLASIRVAEKYGMRFERELRLNNHLVYVYSMARLVAGAAGLSSQCG
jgi:RimJ/RimL family protein N-acetyltransferase